MISISEHMVFWTDSFEKAIKRSYIPGDKADSNIGFAQDLQIKSECASRKQWLSVVTRWTLTDNLALTS